MVEKSDLENSIYRIWVNESLARDVAAATKREATPQYGVFRRCAGGSGSRIGDIEAWIASNIHFMMPRTEEGGVSHGA